MPEVSADFRTSRSASSPASTSPTTRRSRAQKRELIAAGLRLLDQAPLRPALEEPATCTCWRTPRSSACRSCARRRIDEQDSRSTTTREVEGLRALDRYTFQVKLAEPSPRFLYNFADGVVHRRGGARGGRGLRRQDHGAPGGHRPVPAGASGGAARGSCWSATRLPRGAATTKQPPADDAARAGASPRELKGRRLPMVDRVEISHHRGDRSRAGCRS